MRTERDPAALKNISIQALKSSFKIISAKCPPFFFPKLFVKFYLALAYGIRHVIHKLS